MSGERRLLSWLEDKSDWLSPIVVKEVRQVVRGREFNYSFGASLVAGLAVAFFGAADALTRTGTSGQWTFVALMGWNVGLNAGGGLGNGVTGWLAAFTGVLVTMTGMLLPSTILTYVATRWSHRNRELRVVRAFKQGMAPIVVGLLMATGWVLVRGGVDTPFNARIVAVALVSMVIVWRTRTHLLWLLGAGAVLGAFGLV